MPSDLLIDAHTHTFATAERGVAWQRSVGHKDPARTGTTDELLDIMAGAGISHAVMLMYTPTRFMYEAALRKAELPDDPVKAEGVKRELKAKMAERMVENNEWAVQETARHPELITFAGLDPVYMSEQEMLAEIEDKVGKGAKGVKIVPTALATYGNDGRLWPVYDKISRLGVPMLSQSGGRSENGVDAWGRPKYFAEALADFPNLKLILAHLGRGYEQDTLDLCRWFPNLHADVSARLQDVEEGCEFTPDSFVDFLRRCGSEHILFGTNYPTHDPVQFRQVMDALPLTDEERKLIGRDNARRVIGIT